MFESTQEKKSACIAPGLETLVSVFINLLNRFGEDGSDISIDEIQSWIVNQPVADFGADKNLTFEKSLISLGSTQVDSVYLPAKGENGSPTDYLKMEIIPIEEGSKRITLGLLIGQYPLVPSHMRYLPDRTDLPNLFGAMMETLRPDGMLVLDFKTFYWDNLSTPDCNSQVIQSLISLGLSHSIISVEHTNNTEDKFIIIFKNDSPQSTIKTVQEEIYHAREVHGKLNPDK